MADNSDVGWRYIEDKALVDAYQAHWGDYDQPAQDGFLPVGSGWTGILADLHADLEGVFPDFVIVQIKNKFGALRIYGGPFPDAYADRTANKTAIDQFNTITGKAETASQTTCEACGNPGVLRNWNSEPPRGAWVTLCDEHHETLPDPAWKPATSPLPYRNQTTNVDL